MKLKSLLSFKPKLTKPKLTKSHCPSILSMFVLSPKNRCFSLKRPRFRRRRFRTKAIKFKKRFSVKALKFPKCHPRPSFKLKKPGRRRKIIQAGKNPTLEPAPELDPVLNGDRFGEKVAELLSVFRSSRRSTEIDMVTDLKTAADNEIRVEKEEPLSAPVVHDHATLNTLAFEKDESGDDVEDGDQTDDMCRSFENYVAEMIVEEGKLQDLMDVEEMLYCWRNLKSPVFVDLVCRFYGELCRDLFSADEEGKITASTVTTVSE